MKKFKRQTPVWVILFWLIALFTYHWGMTTLEDKWQFERECQTHDFVLGGLLDLRGSSGIMVGWDEAKKEGYVLTCFHVVENDIFRTIPVTIITDSITGATHKEEGRVEYWDESIDLAIVVVKKKQPIFTVMTDDEYKWRVKKDMKVWAAGNPTGDLGGQMLSVGRVLKPSHSYKCPHCPEHEDITGLLHDATMWYGFSGGPLVDPRTSRVVALNFRLGEHAKSDTGMAVPAPVINTFLKDCNVVNR